MVHHTVCRGMMQRGHSMGLPRVRTLRSCRGLDRTGSRHGLLRSSNSPPMLLAAENCQWDVVKLLIMKGANTAPIDSRGRSVLSIAARRGALDVVQLLAQKGPDINHADDQCWVPLSAASFGRHCKVVDFCWNRARRLASTAPGKGCHS